MAKKIPKPCKHPGCPNLTHDRFCDEHQKQKRLEPCREQGCPNLVPGGGYCGEHAARLGSTARGYDRNWQKASKSYLGRHPFCVVTGEFAEEVDHIKPLRCGGKKLDENNLQSLTHRVHSIKTGWEKRIGDDKLSSLSSTTIATMFYDYYKKRFSFDGKRG